MEKMKITILPNYFLNDNGKFNLKSALDLCGKIAGVCYDKEGFEHLTKEAQEKTDKSNDKRKPSSAPAGMLRSDVRLFA